MKRVHQKKGGKNRKSRACKLGDEFRHEQLYKRGCAFETLHF